MAKSILRTFVILAAALAANTGLSRTALITLLGQSIPITQSAPDVSLGATARLEGPLAGMDNVVLAVTPQSRAWTATTNAFWLHLSTANQSGTGSTNVIFAFDANPGQTRTGTLTIAGQTRSAMPVSIPRSQVGLGVVGRDCPGHVTFSSAFPHSA